MYRLIRLIFSNPSITIRLLTWQRVKNGCRAILYNQGNWGLLLKRYSAIYSNKDLSDILSKVKTEKYIGDVFLFPAIDWSFRFQRPQHIARELSNKGYRVFYISTVPLIAKKKSNYEIQDIPVPGVLLVQLSSGNFRAPDMYMDELTDGEVLNLKKSFYELIHEFSVSKYTLLVQHPFWQKIVSAVNDHNIIYDCIDFHDGFFAKVNNSLRLSEKILADKARTLVVTSDYLLQNFEENAKNFVIRNGCEYERFGRVARLKSKDKNIIGYIGAVSDWFDGKLLYSVAKLRPDLRFEIYGAVTDPYILKSRQMANVKFHGEIAYENVPETIATFDVCLIPFKIKELTLATNPVKVYEYLAVGRPVVATKLPELAELENLDVFCADKLEEFCKFIDKALLISDLPERINIRKRWASENDWSNRVDELSKLPPFCEKV